LDGHSLAFLLSLFTLVFKTWMALLSFFSDFGGLDGRSLFSLYNSDEKIWSEALSVVFYDGDCGLCQRSIRFLAWADKKKKISFAPLNGVTYKQIYGDVASLLSSVKLYHNKKTYEKSSAVLQLCLILGGFYKIFYLFIIVPAFIRDALYDQIASRRKTFSCVLIKRDERFLN
jgi:predicted DCC family thiol-disulfide oxidoreductase YuxK